VREVVSKDSFRRLGMFLASEEVHLTELKVGFSEKIWTIGHEQYQPLDFSERWLWKGLHSGSSRVTSLSDEVSLTR
jgi:hypothetical protein